MWYVEDAKFCAFSVPHQPYLMANFLCTQDTCLMNSEGFCSAFRHSRGSKEHNVLLLSCFTNI